MQRYFDDINGYWRVRVRGHKFFKVDWVNEQRFVMAEKLGRPLLRTELVHHINEDKTDNSPENLELVTRSTHPGCHRGRKNSEETKQRMAESAKARCTPEWREAVSNRVKDQHAQSNFGRKSKRT